MAPRSVELVIRPTPPFRLDLTVWALRRRARNIVDRWDGEVYSRVLVVDSGPVEISVTQTGPADKPTLNLRAAGGNLHHGGSLDFLKASVERILGTNIDLAPFYALAERDKELKQLASKLVGLKPPRFPSVFEALVNAISCQQLSLTVGIVLLNRLTRECGVTTATGESAFPRPCDILRVSPETFRRLGFSRQKANSILSLAEEVNDRKLDLDALDNAATDSVQGTLLGVHGVGRWTAEYTLLRGLRRLEVFPGDDVGARNGLVRWLNRTEQQLDYKGIQNTLGRWKPYGGFIYFHLLLEGLTRSGEMKLTSGPQSISTHRSSGYAEHATTANDLARLSNRTLAG